MLIKLVGYVSLQNNVTWKGHVKVAPKDTPIYFQYRRKADELLISPVYLFMEYLLSCMILNLYIIFNLWYSLYSIYIFTIIRVWLSVSMPMCACVYSFFFLPKYLQPMTYFIVILCLNNSLPQISLISIWYKIVFCHSYYTKMNRFLVKFTPTRNLSISFKYSSVDWNKKLILYIILPLILTHLM